MFPTCLRNGDRTRALRRLSPAVLGLAVVRLTPDASAIVRRADYPNDASYIALGNDAKYTSVVATHDLTQFTGSGVLISPKWVLSAGHVVLGNPNFNIGAPTTINIGGTSATNGTNYGVLQQFSPYTGDLAAGNDIGLIQLSSAVTTITPASRYYYTVETNMVGTSVGFGSTGTGLTGDTGSGGGVKRGMQNMLDTLATAFGYSENTIVTDFDDPANADGRNVFGNAFPLELEGISGGGDSGGGVFVDLNTRTYVDAIHGFVIAFNSPHGDGSPNASYSDAMGSTRVSVHNIWIDDNITNDWKTAANGSFNTAANWKVGTFTSGAPVQHDLAGFNVAGSYTVTFGSNVSNHMLLARRGDVTLDLNSFSYTLTSTMFEGGIVVGRYNGNDATMTFRNGTVTAGDMILGQLPGATGRIRVGSNATLNVTGNAYVGGDFNGIAGIGVLNIENANSAVNVAGTLKVTGNGIVNYNNGTLATNVLEIADAGQVFLAPGGNKLLKTNSLVIAGSGLIDLSDNDLLIDYTGASPNSQVRDWLINDSILSSAGTANRGLGYADNAFLGKTSFNGISIDLTSELVKYTYFGDADLDGDVDAVDLGRFAQSWQATSQWIGGDFNYDGKTDLKDLILLANNWQMGVGAPLSVAFDDALSAAGLPATLATAVPEPTAFGLLAGLAPVLLRRRSRIHA